MKKFRLPSRKRAKEVAISSEDIQATAPVPEAEHVAPSISLSPLEGETDYEEMSIDRLIEHKLRLKEDMNLIREEIIRVHAIYTRKLIEWHRQEALKRVGLEDVVVSPGPAILKAEGK